MITKMIRKVTGTSEGLTFTKEEKEILNIQIGSIVEVKKPDSIMDLKLYMIEKFNNIRRDYNKKHTGVKSEEEFLGILLNVFRYGRKEDHEKIYALTSELEKRELEIKQLRGKK